MNWSEFITKLKGYLLVVQDTTASKYTRIKAGLAILALISQVLPDNLPFGANESLVSNNGDINAVVASIESALPATVGVGAVDKIGDGTLIKLFLELAKMLGPILIPLLI